MRLVFGLGNPGKEYYKTRHNVGFLVIDYLSEKFKIGVENYSFRSLIGEGKIKGEEIILCKPLTFVNESGASLKEVKAYYQLNLEDIIVISDDADLPLGRIRIAKRGGSGGHKGLKSIIQSLETENFPRLRIGIGRPSEKMGLRDYVLEEFTPLEWEIMELIIQKVTLAIETIFTQGLDEAMQEYNRPLQEVKGKCVNA
ncbi:aminoacyl-tRNA hydrolase [Candidatus Aerophobetes bacterium]|nr:aminoacyl-tRNA hydrolase [Candidatus Aerophobetes bacterium]